MSRRYQELEERRARDLTGAKDAIKRLGPEERAHVLAWLCKYFGDDGERAENRPLLKLGSDAFWLVRKSRAERDRPPGEWRL
jgi:hypothetical protein